MFPQGDRRVRVISQESHPPHVATFEVSRALPLDATQGEIFAGAVKPGHQRLLYFAVPLIGDCGGRTSWLFCVPYSSSAENFGCEQVLVRVWRNACLLY